MTGTDNGVHSCVVVWWWQRSKQNRSRLLIASRQTSFQIFANPSNSFFQFELGKFLNYASRKVTLVKIWVNTSDFISHLFYFRLIEK